jgi:hypothetical protein
MKNYKVTLFRKKIAYEVCDLVVQAVDKEAVREHIQINYIDECSAQDGSYPPDMHWEEDVSEYDGNLSEPYIDEIKEIV